MRAFWQDPLLEIDAEEGVTRLTAWRSILGTPTPDDVGLIGQ